MVLVVAFVFLLVRLFVGCSFLVVASWMDVERFEVSNLVWKVFGVFAFCVSVFELFVLGGLFVFDWLFSVGVSFGFALVVYLVGGFGGADCKCLWCIGLLFPFWPLVSVGFLGGFLPFALVTYLVACLFSVFFVNGFCVLSNVLFWFKCGFLFPPYVKSWWDRLRLFLFYEACSWGRVDGWFLRVDDCGCLGWDVDGGSFVFAKRRVPFVLFLFLGFLFTLTGWLYLLLMLGLS